MNKQSIIGKSKIILLLIMAITVVISAIIFGNINVSLIDFFHDDKIAKAIINLRIIRVSNAFIIGAALSISGLIYQTILRNQLAEPSILGVSSGAGLGASLMIFCGLSSKYMFVLPLGAFLGGTVAISIVLVLCSALNARSLFSINLAILIGVIISNLFSSALMTLVALAPAGELNSISWWLLGSLEGGNYQNIVFLFNLVAVTAIVTSLWGRELNLLSIDQQLSYNVGINNMALTVVFLLISSLLTSLAVSFSGIIGFVGLIVPHIIRVLWGPNIQKNVWLVFIFGGTFLVFCDLISRVVLQNRELPVGIITTGCGGIFFIYLLFKNRRSI